MSSDDEENTAWVHYWQWVIWGIGSVAVDILYANDFVYSADAISPESGISLEFGSLTLFIVLIGVFGLAVKNFTTCRIGWAGQMFFIYHALRAAHIVLLRIEAYAEIVQSQILAVTLVVLDVIVVALFWARIRAYDRTAAAQTG